MCAGPQSISPVGLMASPKTQNPLSNGYLHSPLAPLLCPFMHQGTGAMWLLRSGQVLAWMRPLRGF